MGSGGLCPPVTCGTGCVSASEGPSMWTWIAGATENRAALLHRGPSESLHGLAGVQEAQATADTAPSAFLRAHTSTPLQ